MVYIMVFVSAVMDIITATGKVSMVYLYFYFLMHNTSFIRAISIVPLTMIHIYILGRPCHTEKAKNYTYRCLHLIYSLYRYNIKKTLLIDLFDSSEYDHTNTQKL